MLRANSEFTPSATGANSASQPRKLSLGCSGSTAGNRSIFSSTARPNRCSTVARSKSLNAIGHLSALLLHRRLALAAHAELVAVEHRHAVDEHNLDDLFAVDVAA